MTATNSPFPGPPEKRSPFPKPSLPQAGESLRNAALDLFLDRLIFWVMFASVFIGIALVEWWQRWAGRISPWFWTVLAVLATLFAVHRWYKIKPQLEQMGLGIRGERIVGQMLERMRTLGYEVFHDIPGESFNVDHVLIGPGGIFVIETKMRSKSRGKPSVDYDGQTVLVNGFAPDRDPVVQAKENARFIQRKLENMTGRTVTVRPVVLFPGWYINGSSSGREVWVLNENTLPKFIANERPQLKREDIALFADRLTTYITGERSRMHGS